MTTTIKSNNRLTQEEHIDLVKRLPKITGVGGFTSDDNDLLIRFNNTTHQEMFFLYESDRQNFDDKVLVDPAVFYQRAKYMYDDSKNLPEEWRVTEPDELTACLSAIRDLCTQEPVFSEMEALAERFARLIPANYGMLWNMHLE